MIVEKFEILTNYIEFEINSSKYIVFKEDLLYSLKEVERWQKTGGTNFKIKLIELIAKADDYNKSRLLKSFPEVVFAYLLWFYKNALGQNIKEEQKFFDVMYKKLSN